MSQVTDASAERFLAGPLLGDLERDDRIAFEKILRPLKVAAGGVLLQEGKTNERLWFLIDGEASIERNWRGKTVAIARLTPPGIFGATTFFRPSVATVTIRAVTDASLLTLDRDGHDRLRRENPKAAEVLALATVRVLSERFDLLDSRMTEFMANPSNDLTRANEWARFRSRLFEEPNII